MWNKRTDCSVKDHRTQPEQSPAAKHIQQTVKFPTFLRKKTPTVLLHSMYNLTYFALDRQTPWVSQHQKG